MARQSGWPTLAPGWGGWFLVGRNLAAGMLLQATAYTLILWRLWESRPSAWWLPFAVIALAFVVDRKRLSEVVLPRFFDGLRGRVRRA